MQLFIGTTNENGTVRCWDDGCMIVTGVLQMVCFQDFIELT